jgi:hypothetical protein
MSFDARSSEFDVINFPFEYFAVYFSRPEHNFQKIFLANPLPRFTKEPFFEIANCLVRSITQTNVREPRENRGRLRHCNGLQTPTATGRSPLDREGGSEVQARSQDTGLIALVRSALSQELPA